MKLHLGCGNDIRPGWINIDLSDRNHPDHLKHDLTLPFPPHIKEVDYIYSCHFLEHVSPQELSKLLINCKKVLKSGGVFRAALPNFRSLAEAYVNGEWNFFDILPKQQLAPNNELIEIVNYGIYQYEGNYAEHKHMFDVPYIIKILKNHGFKEPKEVPWSDIDPPTELRKRYSFVVEAYGV